jgi:hypothetical protein
LSNEVKIHLIGFTVFSWKLKLRRQRLNHFFYVFLRNGFAKAMVDRNNIRHRVFHQVSEVLWLGKAMRPQPDWGLSDIKKSQELFLFLFWYFAAESLIIDKFRVLWRVFFIDQKHITVKVFDVLSWVEFFLLFEIWCFRGTTLLSFNNCFIFERFCVVSPAWAWY